jgi:hypothetical protein
MKINNFRKKFSKLKLNEFNNKGKESQKNILIKSV